MDLSFNNAFSIAAILAACTFIATCYRQIKSWFSSLSNVFLQKTYIDVTTSEILIAYCLKNMKTWRYRPKTYIGDRCTIVSQNRAERVLFSVFSHRKSLLFYSGRDFLFVCSGADSHAVAGLSGPPPTLVEVLSPRFSFDLTKVLAKAIDANEERLRASVKPLEQMSWNRFAIYRICGRDKSLDGMMMGKGDESTISERGPTATKGSLLERCDMPILPLAQQGTAFPLRYAVEDLKSISANIKNPFDFYPYPPHVMQFVADCERWKQSQEWFSEKQIPWRRGALFVGKPGSGKTLLIKSLAQHLNLPVYLFDLASMSNQELYRYWDQSTSNSPAMIVLEDFDSIFHGRENVCGESSSVSFDAILNCISGIKQCDGIFLAVTVNDISKIDSAIGLPDPEKGISSRPGRIDEIIYINEMDADCRRKLAARMLEHPPHSEVIDEIVERGDGMTGAQFCEICKQECLKTFWIPKEEHVSQPA